MQQVIDEWLKEGVIARIIEPTQFNTPIFPIPKKDPSGAKTLCRPCMDFRALNDLITSDKYPLPLISDIFEALNGSKYFTSLDLKSAYHRFPVLDEHQHKTAFTWNDIQYKFLRAPFGLKNLPSQFQRVIHFVFQDCPFVRTFIDDAIVFSSGWESHVQHVRQAIARLNEARLILNVEKCHFFQTSLLLLGFHIDSYGHSVDHEHAKKTVDWPVPTTGKQIQAFLGFVNYFREHIPMVSKITAPLDKLRTLQKIRPSGWTEDCQQAFDNLKSILFAAPALAYPDFKQPFFIATDASGVGIGAVLYQFDPESREQRFVSFQARALTKSEHNYSATKRELLAIVFAFRKFHRYIWGTHFTLYTDHRALTYLHTQQNLSPMLVGWYDLIFDYNFAVFHRPGIKNVLPDALSRFFPEEIEASRPARMCVKTITATSPDSSNELLIAQLSPDAVVPTKAYPSDAGFDLYAIRGEIIPAGKLMKIPTGIAAKPPPGCYLQIADRSSMALKGIHVNGDVIDPSYTGEISVLLRNHNEDPFIVHKGDRIAQMIPIVISSPIITIVPQVALLIGNSDRGNRGFGSSNDSDSDSQEGGESDPPALPRLSYDFPDTPPLEAAKYNGERFILTLRKLSAKPPSDMTPEQQRQLLHKQHLLGHFGPEAIVKALKANNIQWPKMLEDATNVCRSCIQCLRYNIARRGYHPLTPIVADQPFDHIAIDLAGPFTTSTDKQHWLLVIIDIHSRFVLLRTLPNKSGAEVAQALLKVFYDFGFPRIIQSDNGTEFVNQIVKDVTESAKIDHRLITPYHPRANGAAERTVQTAKRLIFKLIRGVKHDWSLFVPFAQYCINSKIAARTKTTPFVAMFGR